MRVLAVGCHPDDIEIGCGGTLVRCARRGDEVVICHVASGDMGHVKIEPGPLAALRKEEARRGGALLGAKEVISLEAGDLRIDACDRGLARALAQVVRAVDPDVILTHSPEDYMKDHVEVSRLTFDASFSATVTHYGAGAATQAPAPIYYMDTLAGVNFQPEVYVDISEALEKKLEALSCHESQIKWMREHDHIDFADMVRTCAKFRGYQCGVAYAEGFKACKTYPRLTTRHLLP